MHLASRKFVPNTVILRPETQLCQKTLQSCVLFYFWFLVMIFTWNQALREHLVLLLSSGRAHSSHPPCWQNRAVQQPNLPVQSARCLWADPAAWCIRRQDNPRHIRLCRLSGSHQLAANGDSGWVVKHLIFVAVFTAASNPLSYKSGSIYCRLSWTMWLHLISSAGGVALTSLLAKRWYLCGNIQTWVYLGLSTFQLRSRMAAPLTVSIWLG